MHLLSSLGGQPHPHRVTSSYTNLQTPHVYSFAGLWEIPHIILVHCLWHTCVGDSSQNSPALFRALFVAYVRGLHDALFVAHVRGLHTRAWFALFVAHVRANQFG